MLKFHRYLKERFPLEQFLPLCLLFTLVLGIFIQIYVLDIKLEYYNFIWPFLALFLFLLRLRLFDEFKDYEHDLKYYPHRPVARGFVKLKELLPWVLAILFFEVIISFINLYISTILFFVSFIYSLLMFKEFFCSSWLKKKFTIYIVSHEILIIPLFFYIYSLFGLSWQNLNNIFIWCLTLFIGGQLFLLEITRKFRSKDMEIESKDTYTAQYGIRGASFLVFIISVLIILAYFYLILNTFTSVLFISILALILFFLLCFRIFSFIVNPKSNNAKKVFNFSIFFTLGMDVFIVIKFFIS